MKHFLSRRLPTLTAVLFCTVLAACSGDAGPTESGQTARLTGLLSGGGAASAAALAGAAADEPLAGVTVRLVNGAGEVLFESGTNDSGEFDVEAPAGSYRLEIAMGDATFTLHLELEAGHTLFVQGTVDTTGPTPVIDAELFIDDDGDGVSDTGFTVRIVGREAGDPTSGDTVEEGDPDEDLEDEEEEVEDHDPAELADLEDGQKVYVKGSTTPDGFEADEVHGSSGNAGPSCRLSGEVGGVELDAEGDLTAVELFGAIIDVSGARVTGVRGGGAGVEPGTRVEIHAVFDDASGELIASRLHARGASQGRDPERILGFLTAEPAADALEVCGIDVQVADGAKITNGGGRSDDDEDGEGDEGGEDDEQDDEDDDVTFAEFLASLGDGAFNHDVRGRFDGDGGVLLADHLTAADRERSGIEIVGDVADLDAGAGTFRLLGLPVLVVETTDFHGGLEGVESLEDGLHVRARIEDADGGALIAATLQRAGEPFDRLRGGTLAAVSADLAANPNFAVGLPEALELPVDADAGTTFGIED